MKNIAKLLNIKPEEYRLVLLLLGFSFGVGLATSFLKTIADASFIIHFGIGKVPEAIIIGGVLGYILNTLLAWFFKKKGFGKVTTFMSVFSFLLITGFCGLLIFGKSIDLPIYWLFIVSMPLAIIIENSFYGTILRYLNYEQNKRLSGLLISGAVFSGIIGCFLIPFLKSILPKPEYLLLFSALGCVLGLILFLSVTRNATEVGVANAKKASAPLIKLPFKSRYFWLMGFFILLSAGLFYVINFGFLYLLGDLKKTYNASLVITLIAVMNGVIKLSEFVLSLYSGKILSRKGVTLGISALPVGLFVSILCAFVFAELNIFWVFFGFIILAKYLERVVRKGLLRPSLNVLYQLFGNKKSKVQLFLDGNVESISATFFGFLLLILVTVAQHDLAKPFTMATSIISLIWCVITITVVLQYRKELYNKLVSINPGKKKKLSNLLFNSSTVSNAIDLSGELHYSLIKPLLIIDNFRVKELITKEKPNKEQIQKNQKLELDFGKLNYLLITHYRLETNPFYEEMKDHFVNEIRDEINKMGYLLGEKYNNKRLRRTFKVVYNSDDPDEKLYAYELLTASINPNDKNKLSTVYRLITSSSLQKSLIYHVQGDKIGMRSIMKSIISEEQYRFSPILRSSAIHVLGQNYVLTVPKEIKEASNSPNDIVREMAEKVIHFDEELATNSNARIMLGDKWLLICELNRIKALSMLGNYAKNQLYFRATVLKVVDKLEEDYIYAFIKGWVHLKLEGKSKITTLQDDYLNGKVVNSVKCSEETIILRWDKMEFLEILNAN